MSINWGTIKRASTNAYNQFANFQPVSIRSLPHQSYLAPTSRSRTLPGTILIRRPLVMPHMDLPHALLPRLAMLAASGPVLLLHGPALTPISHEITRLPAGTGNVGPRHKTCVATHTMNTTGATRHSTPHTVVSTVENSIIAWPVAGSTTD